MKFLMPNIFYDSLPMITYRIQSLLASHNPHRHTTVNYNVFPRNKFVFN